MIVVVAVYSRFAHVSLPRSAEALGAPSQLLPLTVVTVPSTVSGTFYLLRGSQCALDGVIAVVGLLMCACPMMVLCWVAYMAPRRLVRVENSEEASARQMNACLPRALRKPIAVLFYRRVRWVEGKQQRQDSVDVRRDEGNERVVAFEAENGGVVQRGPPSWRRLATAILIDYALVWYVFIDVAVLTAAGFLGAVSSLGSGSACRASAAVLLVLYLGQLVLCAVVRPFTTLFSHVYALFTLTLSTLAVACQVWYLFGSIVGGVDLSALSKLLMAAAVCDIVVSGVSMLKSLFDVVDVLRACRRHIKSMFPNLFVQSSSSEPMQPKPLFEDTLSEAHNELPQSDGAPIHDDEICEPQADEVVDLDITTLMASMFSPASHDDDSIGDDGTILTAKESTYQVHHGLLHFYSQS